MSFRPPCFPWRVAWYTSRHQNLVDNGNVLMCHVNGFSNAVKFPAKPNTSLSNSPRGGINSPNRKEYVGNQSVRLVVNWKKRRRLSAKHYTVSAAHPECQERVASPDGSVGRSESPDFGTMVCAGAHQLKIWEDKRLVRACRLVLPPWIVQPPKKRDRPVRVKETSWASAEWLALFFYLHDGNGEWTDTSKKSKIRKASGMPPPITIAQRNLAPTARRIPESEKT
ncbi:hypothetical protein M407DRAFT_6447 [Tulasnella calospora MUT 4182]|uniref:Uncharacterized protein n=1 Tax=Tulasnella calospora MUT 4182 TaxID=1051891 RepID=A0A0C3QDK4_9AGAM|nr:hypothetical protein M407DRAFT_6447 [Tulasnella calospora MUT 4182]